ncbi:MAG: sodium:proton antiporter [Balneola sp.]
MSEYIAIGLASVLALGISAQWLAWRTKLPAILLLLGFGIIAGPFTGLLDPEKLMGDLLSPFVSISVAIILFEGGLSLKMSEFKKIGGTVIKLITIGVLITWTLSALAALYILDLGVELSVLFGAILIVTGPTVIIPLLRQVRPTEKAGSVVKWEGIVNDPIGAMMAVLVFEVIIAGGFSQISGKAGIIIIQTLAYGTVLGAIGAGIMYYALKKHWIPDYLQNPVTLMVVIGVFVISNHLQHESGLLTVTVMGIILANQKSARIKHIIEFKENLQVLLISALFILLASRLRIEDLEYFNWTAALFIAVLILVIRPAAIFFSTLGSNLKWNEKAFVAWMAPRGIVAAAISAVFALRLEQEGYAEAELLVPYTFIVIIATVTIYGLSASPVARLLKVAKADPTGVIIIGAHNWARMMAHAVKDLGFKVLVADSNWENISKARKSGLQTYYGNILSEYAMEELDFEGIGKTLAFTPNDEVNSLSAIQFSELFGNSQVFQLPPRSSSAKKDVESSDSLGGRTLFHRNMNYDKISSFIDDGAVVKATQITEAFTFDDYKEQYKDASCSLFVVSGEDSIEPFSVDNSPTPQSGDIIIGLVSAELASKNPIATESDEKPDPNLPA